MKRFKILVAFKIVSISGFSVAWIGVKIVEVSSTTIAAATLWTLECSFPDAIRIFNRVTDKALRSPITPAFFFPLITVITIDIKKIGSTSTWILPWNPRRNNGVIIRSNKCIVGTIKCFRKVQNYITKCSKDESSMVTHHLWLIFNSLIWTLFPLLMILPHFAIRFAWWE